MYRGINQVLMAISLVLSPSTMMAIASSSLKLKVLPPVLPSDNPQVLQDGWQHLVDAWLFRMHHA